MYFPLDSVFCIAPPKRPPRKPNTPGFTMTRFALIPLAILANACASAEDVQDELTDMTHEIQRDLEELSAEEDRDTAAYRQDFYDRTHEALADSLASQGCVMVGALSGGWTNPTLQVRAKMIDRTGHVVVAMDGKMRYTLQDQGVFGTKGHISDEATTVIMEGDWYGDRLEADMIFAGQNKTEEIYRFTGFKNEKAGRGEIIGAVAACAN